FYPWLHADALFNSIAGEKTRRNKHIGIGGVRAGGDRRDHYIAVPEIEIFSLDRKALLRLAGLAVLGAKRGLKAGPNCAKGNTPLGPLRPGHGWLDFFEFEFEHIGEDGVRAVFRPKQALRLRIGLDERHPCLRARRGCEIAERLRIDREETAGRAI